MPAADLEVLRRLVQRLRQSDGCPWDRKQGLAEMRSFLLEEAHEAAAAIDLRDWQEISEELGDLLFLIAFVAQLAHEANAFTLAELIEHTERKMIDRHPHVFGTARAATSEEVEQLWQRNKARGGNEIMAGVPASLPSLVAAQRVGQKAAGLGFDWPDIEGVARKVEEELGELRERLATPPHESRAAGIEEEVGDLLFAAANLARRAGVDPEAALGAANRKFVRRFNELDQRVRQRESGWERIELGEMEELWQQVKRDESP